MLQLIKIFLQVHREQIIFYNDNLVGQEQHILYLQYMGFHTLQLLLRFLSHIEIVPLTFSSDPRVSTSLRIYHGPHRPTQSWIGHDKASSPSGGWKDLEWAFRSSKSSTAAPLRASWLVASPLGMATAWHPTTVHHWGRAPCHQGPLYQVASEEGPKNGQRLHLPK